MFRRRLSSVALSQRARNWATVIRWGSPVQPLSARCLAARGFASTSFRVHS